ncbi:MAG: hypothetical protein ACTSU4_03505 [Promethearchaeota archaeon]
MKNLQKYYPIIMSIQAKKEGLLRYSGMGLMFLGLILSIIVDIIILVTSLHVALFIILTITWLTLIALLKLEIDFVVDNFLKIILVVGIVSVFLIIIGSLSTIVVSFRMSFIFIAISSITLSMAWNYSLSIYKREKLFSIIGIIFYLVITILYRYALVTTNTLLVVEILANILVVIGLIGIILGEGLMKKKKLLNYI